MRFFIMFVLLTSSLYAQSDVDKKVKELEEVREEALYKWRTIHKFNNKLPNDEYTKFYKETWDKYLEGELSVYQSACKVDKSKCLNPSQKELKKSQVNVVTGLLQKKNSWAKQGLSLEAQKKKEEEYNREANIDKCALHKVDCEKLLEADRKVAGERAKKPTVVVTTPEVEVTTSKEEKPKEEKPKEEKPKEDIPKEEKPKEEKPEEIKVDVKTSVTLDEVAAILEEKLEGELAALEAEFAKTHPDFKNKELTEEAKNFLKSQEALRIEKVLGIFETLCTKYPQSKEVCLTPSQVKALQDKSAQEVCLIDRKFKHRKDSELIAKIEESHEKDWQALKDPKACAEIDEKPETKKDQQKVVDENEDEKSPRNYKAETCRWVSDLPRKIVNGPGCGPKGRSRICTGYVVCEQKEGGGKFIRMSSCGADKCGNTDADAVRCTKDQGFFSEKPAGESKLFMTPRLKKILSGGASEQ